jgi:ligand-binding sensor domain-containing protein
MRTIYILIAAMVGFALPMVAQKDWLSFTNGKVIKAVAFENQFVWVGTTGGLVRVDTTTGNARFYNKTYEAIPDNWVSALAIDAKGGKWIGTLAAGLAYYDEKKPLGKEWTKYTFLDGLPSDEIHTLTLEGNILWIGTKRGLVKFDGNSWETFNTLNSSLPDNNILSVKIDKNKIKWIGTAKGIASLDANDKVTKYIDEDVTNKPVTAIAFDIAGAPLLAVEYKVIKLVQKDWVVQKALIEQDYIDNSINHIVTDAAGVTWVATSRGGIFKQNGNDWVAINRQNSRLPSNDINLLEIDNKGSRWVGTNNEGLFKYTGTSDWTQYYTSSSAIPDNTINDLKCDKSGNVWFGSKTQGVLGKFTGYSWQTFSKDNSAIPNSALIISVGLEPNNATRWFGTDTKGVFKFDGKNWTNYNSQNHPLPGAQVSVINFDKKGNQWFGTTDGLARFDGKNNWSVYSRENSTLPANSITSLAFDKNEVLWAGTRNGIARFVDGAFQVLNTENSKLPSDIITVIYIDKKDNKWIGTADKGLIKIDANGDYTTYGLAELGDDRIKAIEYDFDGFLWVGTETGGLARFDGTTWKRFTVKNSGLPLNYISALAIDMVGRLWVGTAGGGIAVYSAKGNLNTAVAEASDNQLLTLNIFPNPTSDILNLTLDFPTKSNLNIQLLDISGRKVRQLMSNAPASAGAAEYHFSLLGLDKGIYLLEVVGGMQRVVKKVVVD